MRFSKTELMIMRALGNNITEISAIAEDLDLHISQVYRSRKLLRKKDMVEVSAGSIIPKNKLFISLLLKVLIKNPGSENWLSGPGLDSLILLLSPMTAKELMQAAGQGKDTIYNTLKEFRSRSIVKKSGRTYRFNHSIWPELGDFLVEFKRFDDAIDQRIIPGSTIYYKARDEIIFSSRAQQDAEPTAFSSFSRFGLDILNIRNYYTLPRRRLGIRQVFLHSLIICEKEPEIKNLVFAAVFYLRHSSRLRGIKNPVLDNLKSILRGNKIDGYPGIEEIRDHAEVYGIKDGNKKIQADHKAAGRA